MYAASASFGLGYLPGEKLMAEGAMTVVYQTSPGTCALYKCKSRPTVLGPSTVLLVDDYTAFPAVCFGEILDVRSET
jgi:hypothetical protein